MAKNRPGAILAGRDGQFLQSLMRAPSAHLTFGSFFCWNTTHTLINFQLPISLPTDRQAISKNIKLN